MESKQTQGEKKILTEFKKLIVTHEFTSEVFGIRKAIGIPENGLVMSEEDRSRFYFSIYTPTSLRGKYPEDIPAYFKEMDDAIKRITIKLPFCTSYIEQVVRCYIYYNLFLFDEISQYSKLFRLENLCNISDARKDFEDAFPDFSFQKQISKFLNKEGRLDADFVLDQHMVEILSNMHIHWMKDSVKKYPISLNISESASQRDVIDYIQKNWKHIKALQNRYHGKSSLTFAKTKTNQKILERNEIIYQNREKSGREISKLLQGKNYPDVDIGGIGKIISLEKKKREKK